MPQDEKWADVVLDKNVFYFEKYEVSTYGRVRIKGTDRYLKSFNSNKHNRKNQYWQRVFLYYDEDHQYKVSLHRLVALAFIPNPNPEIYIEVNHIDGNPENNEVSNLEWVTKSENMIHAYINNLILIPKGSSRPNSIFSEDEVRAICYFMEKGYKAKAIYEMLYEYGLTYSSTLTRSKINSLMKHLRKKTHWVFVSEKYNI